MAEAFDTFKHFFGQIAVEMIRSEIENAKVALLPQDRDQAIRALLAILLFTLLRRLSGPPSLIVAQVQLAYLLDSFNAG